MSKVVRSVRNNNPGNIELGGSDWNGAVPGTDKRFVTFGSPEMGVRALTKTINTYQRPKSENGHGLSTIREMISRWAPYGENDTGAYIDFVSKRMGVSADAKLDLKNNPQQMEKFAESIILKEGGSDSLDYFSGSIREGVRLANGGVPSNINTETTILPEDPTDPLNSFVTVDTALDEENKNAYITSDVANLTGVNSTPTSNFSSGNLGNMKELLQYAERQQPEVFWENELDGYENYTYNLEFFIVSEEEANRFLQMKNDEFEKIISGGWPEDSTPRLTIAQTAVTTEFNIDNLVIENLGTGDRNVSKMVGVDTRLSFDITQIGNTDLNDTLYSAAVLMDYTTLLNAIYFIKVTYKGYNYDDPTRADDLPIVKIVPFRLSSLTDLSTVTNATGTTTSLTGTVANSVATTHTINTTKTDFNFVIKPTLGETLLSFKDSLNESMFFETSYDSKKHGDFVNSFDIKLNPRFAIDYNTSQMNDQNANLSSASNELKSKTKAKLNVSTQIGQVPIGVSVINLIYDICIQSLKVRDELLKPQLGFSNVVRVSPEVQTKSHNPVTNVTAYHVTYHISMHREAIIQNVTDQSEKLSHINVLLDEIFQTGRCRKLYNYEYTGLNDQIIDLTISLDKQLVKSYSHPGSEYTWNRFLKDGTSLSDILSEKQLNKYNETNKQLEDFKNTQKQISDTQQQKRTELKNLMATGNELKIGALKNDLTNDSEITNFSPNREDSFMRGLENATSIDEVKAIADANNIDFEQYLTKNETLPDGLKNSIRDLQNEIDGLRTQFTNNTKEISSLTDTRNAFDREIQEQIGVQLVKDGELEKQKINNKNIRNTLLTDTENPGYLLAEELKEDGDIFKKLSDSEFKSLMDAMSLNSINFVTHILPEMRNSPTVSAFKSTDAENVELARSKLFESLEGDLSMSNLSMTIKGDPFWMEFYITEDVKTKMFGVNNTLNDKKILNSNSVGTNYLMLVVNKADGVDEFDNVKIDNLDIFLYMVRNVINTFSRGQFTQQLNCIRTPVPDNFKRKESGSGIMSGLENGSGTGSVDGSGDGSGDGPGDGPGFSFGPGGEFAGVANRIGGGRGINPSLFGDPFGTGENDITGNGLSSSSASGRRGALDPRVVAENGFNTMAGSLSTLATTISEPPMPTAAQASRLTSLLNEANMASNYGSTSATESIENVKSLMQNTFGSTPAEASLILQELEDSGETVSPELIALLNTHAYDGETVTNPIGIDASAVTDVMSQIENYNNLNTASVDEISVRPSEFMTPVVDTVSTNNTPPTLIELENANMMLDGSLPILSTESYTESPSLDYNATQLEALDLPEEVVSGYKDAASTRNGIKVRKYIDSLPQDQADLLNSIDSPYTVKTLPAIEASPTIAEIESTPLKTPREAIIQARIIDAQTQMLAEAGGSYNDLSVDEKRHYENLSDAYDKIDEVAQLDPIRNEAKLLKINDELDKSIRIYNDILAGGDSEWSWNEEEAEEKTQNDNRVLENISNLDNAHSTPIADRVIVDDSGSVNIMKDMSTLPTKPSDGFSLPMDYLSENDEFTITDQHLAQYELAENNWQDFRKGEVVIVNVVDPTTGATFTAELLTSFENPELAERYGIDTTSITAGETISADDPRFIQWNVGNLSDIRNQISSEFPLVTTVNIMKSQEEDAKKIEGIVEINDFVLLEGQGE